MEGDDDYESLPDSSTMGTHMLAGAAAGIMEHTIMYPVDCVKTRMMVLEPDPRARYRNVVQALYRIVQTEGPRRTVRGIEAMVGGAGPAHAMYFACYEKLKKTFSDKVGAGSLAAGAAGACATVAHDAVMNPAEVIKQRMQVFASTHQSCVGCGRTILKTEGPRAFYRSYTTQLSMNIPFQSLHFIVYEKCQDYINPDRQYNPKSHVISGALAGAIAAAATTPLDVCKTLLNTQEQCAVAKCQHPVTGIRQACRTIYEFRGAAGFFRGMTARVLYQMPSTGISWSVYEFFKYYLAAKKNVDCDGYVRPTPIVQVHASESWFNLRW